MSSNSTHGKLVAGVAAALALACAAPALAGDGSVFPPNYKFPDGLAGFSLVSHGEGHGLLLPAVLVGFNSLGNDERIGATTLDLTDPTRPTLFNAAQGDFVMHFSIVGFGDGSVRPSGITDGTSNLHHDLGGGHFLDASFHFSPSPFGWDLLTPRVTPPGNFFAAHLDYTGVDPSASFDMRLDGGDPLTFSLAPFAGGGDVPEPSAWALLLIGFAGTGALLRARRARALVAAA
jgi:hypothetical protein